MVCDTDSSDSDSDSDETTKPAAGRRAAARGAASRRQGQRARAAAHGGDGSRLSQTEDRIDKRLLFLKRVHGGTLPTFDDQHPDPGCAFEAMRYRGYMDPVFVPKLYEKLQVSPRMHLMSQFRRQGRPAQVAPLWPCSCSMGALVCWASYPCFPHLPCCRHFACPHGCAGMAVSRPFSCSCKWPTSMTLRCPTYGGCLRRPARVGVELLLHTCCQPCRQVLARAAQPPCAERLADPCPLVTALCCVVMCSCLPTAHWKLTAPKGFASLKVRMVAKQQQGQWVCLWSASTPAQTACVLTQVL
jgi:hypothetical protein